MPRHRQGKADLIRRDTQKGDVGVWLMNGASVTQLPIVAPGLAVSWQIQ